MSEQYKREILRIATAQICQTVGYNGTQLSPLELLQDVLHKFLQEFCKDLHQNVEHCNRTEAELKDACKTLSSLNINYAELLDYINNVEAINFAFDIPKFPARKNSNLNFLKPGSKEVLTRPMHIFEYLPPILPSDQSESSNLEQSTPSPNIFEKSSTKLSVHNTVENKILHPIDDTKDIFKNENNAVGILNTANRVAYDDGLQKNKPFSTGNFLDKEGKPARKLSSVVMTSGGFISPAIEGKLSEAMIPSIVDELRGLDSPVIPRKVESNAPTQSDLKTDESKKQSIVKDESSKPEIRNSSGSSGIDMSSKNIFKKHGTHALTVFDINQTPEIAARLLKKAKKKSPGSQFRLQGKMKKGDSEFLKPEVPIKGESLKAQKKRLKLMQKLTKAEKADKKRKSKDPSNAGHNQEKISVKTEDDQMEIPSKKHTKQNEKLLKQEPFLENIKSEVIKQELLTNEPANLTIDMGEIKSENQHLDVAMPTTLAIHPTDECHVKNEMDVGLFNKNTDLGKLSNEPDRTKLNIFKKISKQKNPKSHNATTTDFSMQTNALFGADASHMINLPSGTTITPAPLIDNNISLPSVERQNPVDGNLSGMNTTTVQMAEREFMPDSDNANRPKKRGRKPGSKNHPKIPGLNFLKKSKTPKVAKNMYISNVNMPFDGYPMNLTNPTNKLDNSVGKVLPNAPGGEPMDLQGANDLSLFSQQTIAQDKNLMDDLNNMTDSSSRRMNSFLPLTSLSLQMPQTDNAKLKSKLTKETALHSPIKSVSSTKSSGCKKRSQQQRPAVTSPNMPSVGSAPGFINFQTNIMPMMPLYPFAPQPGLIPTPGLFPNPSLGQFPSNHTSPKSLIRNFLAFHQQGKSSISDNESNINARENVTKAGDRSYCNVAPFVPESLKMLPSEREYLKGSKPITIENVKSSKSTEDSFALESNKRLTVSDEGAHMKTNGSAMTNKIPTEFGVPKMLDYKNYFNKAAVDIKPNDTKPFMTDMGRKLDEPIEVSDDSNDESLLTNSKQAQNLMKSNVIITPSSEMQMQSKNIAMTNDALLIKESKKLKKLSKMNKNESGIVIEERNPLSIFGRDSSGIGKLAGGADLIPLSETGLAYSSKSIPSTSLTASFGPLHKDPQNLYDNLIMKPKGTNIDIDVDKKRKEHKKFKKLKDGKVKKKRDKKDKTKSKERAEKILLNTGKTFNEKEFAKYTEKDLLKKLKKEKKKQKQRSTIDMGLPQSINLVAPSDVNSMSTTISGNDLNDLKKSLVVLNSLETSSEVAVPKLTLKLNTSQSPITTEAAKDHQTSTKETGKREPSPELARISPLVTRPPKQKIPISDLHSSGQSAHNTDMSSIVSNHPVIPPPSPWLPGGTLTASSVLLPQQLEKNIPKIPDGNIHPIIPPLPSDLMSPAEESTVPLILENSRPSSYIDAEGNRVWICPACGRVDDGSPMIGCDGCDAWYHWICVGIVVAPKDNVDWFCRVCITKTRSQHGSEKKKKRSKKNKQQT